jgi:hypothetical protein
MTCSEMIKIMKYDIIYKEPENWKWTLQKTADVLNTINEFFKEFQQEYQKKPEKCEIILGIDVWKLINLSASYSYSNNTVLFYDIELNIPSPDWTVHPNYIELNLE